MDKSIVLLGKYLQGEGVIRKLKNYTQELGEKILILATDRCMKDIKDEIQVSYKTETTKLVFLNSNRECTKKEIRRINNICNSKGIEVIVGAGGGVVLDTAKAVGYYQEIPVVLIPTVASSDAPCSSMSVIYKDDGTVDEYLTLRENPRAVIMDINIILKAPVRLLTAGMGDALATYFEARACVESEACVIGDSKPTEAALALAERCYKILMEDGIYAKRDAELKKNSTSVQKIIEANTLLSGIGFENGGLAAAHSIQAGFNAIPECHHMFHGEIVAFGTLVQLMLEQVNEDEINKIYEFCIKLGLPVTLEQMGLSNIVDSDLRLVAEYACSPMETIHNMPFPINPQMVVEAIYKVDRKGKIMINN